MVDVNKLPLSTTSFSNFILKNKIYVDKTDLIAKLALGDTPIFLSRPRRFGKSTLVSTFDELFTHGLEKFKGLKIEKQNLWHDKTYKVLRLDFSEIKDKDQDLSFKDSLLSQLNDAFDANGFGSLDDENIKTPDQHLRKRFISSDIQEPLVLLIDEYDAPLTAVMGDPNEFVIRRDVLSRFFLTIKRYSEKFRFIFITGVTRYSHVSIFSGFNNIKDISFRPRFGTLLGYTQEELEFYFKDYLENAAIVLNQEENTNQYNYEEILKLVKKNYDGYSFDEKCKTHVYNPWSILSFLESPEDGFKSYWLDTGGAKPSLLVNYFTEVIGRRVDKSELLDYLNEDVEISTDLDALSPTIESIEESDFPLEAILYQAGYFTLKRVDDSDYYIGIPNLEVEEAFRKLVLQKLINRSAKEFRDEYKSRAKNALDSKNLAEFKDLLNALLNECSYETVPTFKEAHFRDLYRVSFLCLDFKTVTERQNSEGRSDLDIECDSYLYVLELKVVDENNKDKIEKALQDAKQQINKKKYTVRAGAWLKSKETVGLACVIVNQNKDEKHDTPFREVVKLEEVGPVKIETKKD